mmetsp:Transcript_34179/g.61636  ORF Transcript_34179/g.61636 Transcript_34179/m.61636 type:complete len:272 (-) Transcript_34179:466-1281(-)
MSTLFWGSSTPQVQTLDEAFWYLSITDSQKGVCKQFEKILKENNLLVEGQDDFTLFRFLKARNWNIAKATEMYANMAKWRKEKNIDQLYDTFRFDEEPQILKHYPHFFHKRDKFGRPVYVEHLGQTDSDQILSIISLERLMDYHIYEWEKLEREILVECSKDAGKPILTKTVIIDMKGISMKNFGSAARKILRSVAAIDQDYYPEHLGQMFIVNAPTIFRAIWSVVNPLLEERTRRKILILGSDFLSSVLQIISIDDLPICLGGKSVVPSH